jgi:hypothetical protein
LFNDPLEKINCDVMRVIFELVWVATSTPKNFQKIINFLSLLYRSIFAWEALIHSMLIREVNNMRNSLFEAIMTSIGKK